MHNGFKNHTPVLLLLILIFKTICSYKAVTTDCYNARQNVLSTTDCWWLRKRLVK